jgi:hypothetical protein
VEHYRRIATLSVLIIILLVILTKPDINSFIFKSLSERGFYLNVSPAIVATQHIAGGHGTIEDVASLLFGVGAGQFVISIPKYTIQTFAIWQFQPVHNVFLLIWSELGLIGLGLFTWFLWILLPPFSIIRRRAGDEVARSKGLTQNNQSILNNVNSILSSEIALRYFKAILLGFLFIMLFDHYLWDIQQGSILLWMTLGLIAGIRRK